MTDPKNCSVANFVNQPLPWEKWCDCMFSTTITETAYFVAGVNSRVLSIAFPGLSPLQLAQKMVQMGGNVAKIETRQTQRVVRTPEWRKCVSKYCAAPIIGCGNNYTNDNDPFNVHPGAALAPWTNAGAVARGIPDANPTLFSTLLQLTSIDASEYLPLNLWRTYWTNLGKYALLAAKAVLFAPGVGPWLVGAMAQPLTLAPLAIGQAIAERRDLANYVIKPMLEGGIDQLSFAGKLSGGVLGAQWAAVAGMTAGKFAQDQIKTGELSRIADPIGKGVVVFLAESGEELGRIIQDVINSTGNVNPDTGTIPGVFNLLKTAFRALSGRAEFTPEMRGAMLLVADAMAVGYAISDGAAKGHTPPQITDDIFYELFGIRFAEVQQALSRSAGDLKTLLSTQARTPTSIDDATARLDGISTTLTEIADRLTEIADKIGFGIEKLADAFNQTSNLFGRLQQDATTAILAAKRAEAVAPAPMTMIKLTSGGSRALTLPVKLTRLRIAPAITTQIAIQPPSVGPVGPTAPPVAPRPLPVAQAGAGSALVGAGAGFLVGGPPGALLGGGAGYIYGKLRK